MARYVFYGIVTALLLFALPAAVQKTLFSRAPEAREDLGRPGPRAAFEFALGALTPAWSKRTGSIDPAAAPDQPAAGEERGGAPRPQAGALPDQALAAGVPASPGSHAAPNSPDRASSDERVALAGVGAASAPVAQNPATPLPTGKRSSLVREVFFGDSEETACQPGDRRFSLGELRFLHVCTVLGGLAGTHWSQLTFLSPDGGVYQRLTQAFVTAGASPTAATVQVEGWPYQVQQAGFGGPGETLVDAILPVGGTYITQRSLAGLWRVIVSLDGQPVDQDYFELIPQ